VPSPVKPRFSGLGDCRDNKSGVDWTFGVSLHTHRFGGYGYFGPAPQLRTKTADRVLGCCTFLRYWIAPGTCKSFLFSSFQHGENGRRNAFINLSPGK
jgi:hypothetical protein